jgi:hypothetical protein
MINDLTVDESLNSGLSIELRKRAFETCSNGTQKRCQRHFYCSVENYSEMNQLRSSGVLRND